MTCCSADKLMMKSLDGTLTGVERELLEHHLQDCAVCRQAWEEQRSLALLARRWVPRAAPTEMPADDFAAQVLARVADRSQPAPRSLWLPLMASGLAMLTLAALPHSLWPVLPNFGGAAQALPGWLLATGRSLPADTLTIWADAQRNPVAAPWSWGVVVAACVVNASFYACAARSRLKGSLS